MKWNMKRHGEKGVSRIALGIVGILAAMGLFVLYEELPSLRRYIRIERM